jgi:hypothetical protein
MPSKFEENTSKDKRMFIDARTRTRVLARVRAVREDEKYVVHATCFDLQYVHHTLVENTSIDKQTFTNVIVM